MQRLLFGAIAGLSATMAMTFTMRLLFLRLDRANRYPLPPREITEDMVPVSRQALPALTVLAHFGYGSLAGALFALLPRWLQRGPVFGVAIWALSYLGWLPAAGVLKPATHHPAPRDVLMILVHVVWGAALGACLRELDRSSAEIFRDGRQPDRQRSRSAKESAR